MSSKMKQRVLAIVVFLLGLSLGACGLAPAESPGQASPDPATTTAPATITSAPATAVATETAIPQPTATATVALPATMTPVPPREDLALHPGDISIYPAPRLYSGDSATFQIVPRVPEQVTPGDVVVQIEVADRLTLEGGLNGRTLSGKPVGLFTWAWETQGEVGEYQITVTVDPEDTIQIGDADPDNNQVTLTVPVLPARSRPSREQNAAWITTESACCTIHVVSGTAAHRDLNQLKEMADRAVQQAAERLGVHPQEKIHLYLIDRVIGQGGYAGSNMVISYLDRNYIGNGIYEVLVHETVHVLDRQFASSRIPFLAEGLAVWVTGGHYNVEDIDQRIVALRETGLYIPLYDLVDNFYEHQHEIGYLEAAGFIDYLIDSYGWERVRAFYGDVGTSAEQSDAKALDAALQTHFGRTLNESEASWLAYIDTLTPNASIQADLLTTVRYYNMVREYQLRYDPTAHYLQAWLPFPQELEQRQLTAELSRHPDDKINVTMEVMLFAVDQAIRASDYRGATVILDSLQRALANNGEFGDPLGMQYWRIVEKLTGVGYEVHQVDVSGDRAYAQVTEGRRIYLKQVSMVLRNQAWVLIN